MVKSLPAMWETWVRSLGREDPMEKEMTTYSSILAWKIPWMEEPGRLQSMGLQRVRHDWTASLSLYTFTEVLRRLWKHYFLQHSSNKRCKTKKCIAMSCPQRRVGDLIKTISYFLMYLPRKINQLWSLGRQSRLILMSKLISAFQPHKYFQRDA